MGGGRRTQNGRKKAERGARCKGRGGHKWRGGGGGGADRKQGRPPPRPLFAGPKRGGGRKKGKKGGTSPGSRKGGGGGAPGGDVQGKQAKGGGMAIFRCRGGHYQIGAPRAQVGFSGKPRSIRWGPQGNFVHLFCGTANASCVRFCFCWFLFLGGRGRQLTVLFSQDFGTAMAGFEAPQKNSLAPQGAGGTQLFFFFRGWEDCSDITAVGRPAKIFEGGARCGENRKGIFCRGRDFFVGPNKPGPRPRAARRWAPVVRDPQRGRGTPKRKKQKGGGPTGVRGSFFSQGGKKFRRGKVATRRGPPAARTPHPTPRGAFVWFEAHGPPQKKKNKRIHRRGRVWGGENTKKSLYFFGFRKEIYRTRRGGPVVVSGGRFLFPGGTRNVLARFFFFFLRNFFFFFYFFFFSQIFRGRGQGIFKQKATAGGGGFFF